MPLQMFKPPVIGHIIAVAAGKGGVGKSTVTANLALALKNLNFKVGILDADLYGPSIRKMLPEDQLPEKKGDQLFPAVSSGIKVMSMAYFGMGDKARAVRAPVANSLITQFLNSVEWGSLDFLIIDFPPGTGDIQLTLAQKAKIAGAVMVTTPQEVSVIDVVKAIDLFKTVNIPVLGIVENMSYLEVDSETTLYPFGRGGGEMIETITGARLLANLPIDPLISASCDKGVSLFEQEGALDAKRCFTKLAKDISSLLGRQTTGRIQKFWQIDSHNFGIIWENEKEMVFKLSELQEKCPCALCYNAREKGQAINVNPFVKARSIDPVGHYALKIHFEEGCTRGIYDFDYLYTLGAR